jgi:hypothetical protein
MTDITENRCVAHSRAVLLLTSGQSADPPAEPIPPLVQYHVKGEFKPIDIIISSAEPSRTEEATSQSLAVLSTAELLQDATGIAKVVEEYVPPVEEYVPPVKEYVPPVEEVAEREPEPQPGSRPEPENQYSTWDASKLVTAWACSRCQVTNRVTEPLHLWILGQRLKIFQPHITTCLPIPLLSKLQSVIQIRPKTCITRYPRHLHIRSRPQSFHGRKTLPKPRGYFRRTTKR